MLLNTMMLLTCLAAPTTLPAVLPAPVTIQNCQSLQGT